MADIKLVKESWTAPDGKEIFSYYLQTNLLDQVFKFKVVATPNEKALLDTLVQPTVKK